MILLRSYFEAEVVPNNFIQNVRKPQDRNHTVIVLGFLFYSGYILDQMCTFQFLCKRIIHLYDRLSQQQSQ